MLGKMQSSGEDYIDKRMPIFCDLVLETGVWSF